MSTGLARRPTRLSELLVSCRPPTRADKAPVIEIATGMPCEWTSFCRGCKRQIYMQLTYNKQHTKKLRCPRTARFPANRLTGRRKCLFRSHNATVSDCTFRQHYARPTLTQIEIRT